MIAVPDSRLAALHIDDDGWPLEVLGSENSSFAAVYPRTSSTLVLSNVGEEGDPSGSIDGSKSSGTQGGSEISSRWNRLILALLEKVGYW